MGLMRFAVLALLAAVAGGCVAGNSSKPLTPQADATTPTPKTVVEHYGVGDRMYAIIGGETRLKSERLMEDETSPDHRRQGIFSLVKYDFGQTEIYTRQYRQIAQHDTDFTVRAAAIRALNWSRDRGAAPIFIEALGDSNELIRWEAAKALANVPDPSAVDPLTRALNNPAESKNVRVAAADALRHYHNLIAARALVNTLGGKDFGIAWQARESLHAMTGNDLRYNERAWLEFLTSDKKPLG
jgi:hypothetical protein